jgi:hypothetical protein
MLLRQNSQTCQAVDVYYGGMSRTNPVWYAAAALVLNWYTHYIQPPYVKIKASLRQASMFLYSYISDEDALMCAPFQTDLKNVRKT